MYSHLKEQDPTLYQAIVSETNRQQKNIELIASENFVSRAVLEAQGSILTNKYAEGYPGKRYYGGCQFIDVVEKLAIKRAQELFKVQYANVQPHSGSQANAAAYKVLIQPGDKVLGMDLQAGGHLTHGSSVNFSGQTYAFVSYGVEKNTEQLNYDHILKIAKKEQPKLIIAGASAYGRTIDFKRFREIADEVGAYLMVDMAHIAGLVATGVHPSPIPYAHIVTSTTHKTLRGPRGGLILTNDSHLAKKIDAAIFPGTQGGPLEHVIAGKAVAFAEALTKEFVEYSKQIIKNAKAMANVFKKEGHLRLISNDVDNHLLLLDVTKVGLTGQQAEHILDEVHITVNKNGIPFDTKNPTITSGIRIGTPAITTRGMKEKEAEQVAFLILKALTHFKDHTVLQQVKDDVDRLTAKYPLPYPIL